MKKYIRTVILLSYYKRIRDLREDSDKNQSDIAEELSSLPNTEDTKGERGNCRLISRYSWQSIITCLSTILQEFLRENKEEILRSARGNVSLSQYSALWTNLKRGRLWKERKSFPENIIKIPAADKSRGEIFIFSTLSLPRLVRIGH